jgi:hypothetical protein
MLSFSNNLNRLSRLCRGPTRVQKVKAGAQTTQEFCEGCDATTRGLKLGRAVKNRLSRHCEGSLVWQHDLNVQIEFVSADFLYQELTEDYSQAGPTPRLYGIAETSRMSQHAASDRTIGGLPNRLIEPEGCSAGGDNDQGRSSKFGQ